MLFPFRCLRLEKFEVQKCLSRRIRAILRKKLRQYVRENRCPNFAGLFTTKVIKSDVKLHVKSDAQKACELTFNKFCLHTVTVLGTNFRFGPTSELPACRRLLFPNVCTQANFGNSRKHPIRGPKHGEN